MNRCLQSANWKWNLVGGLELERGETTFQQLPDGSWFAKQYKTRSVHPRFPDRYLLESCTTYGVPKVNEPIDDAFFSYERFEMAWEKLEMQVVYPNGHFEEYIWHPNGWGQRAKAPPGLHRR